MDRPWTESSFNDSTQYFHRQEILKPKKLPGRRRQ